MALLLKPTPEEKQRIRDEVWLRFVTDRYREEYLKPIANRSVIWSIELAPTLQQDIGDGGVYLEGLDQAGNPLARINFDPKGEICKILSQSHKKEFLVEFGI